MLTWIGMGTAHALLAALRALTMLVGWLVARVERSLSRARARRQSVSMTEAVRMRQVAIREKAMAAAIAVGVVLGDRRARGDEGAGDDHAGSKG